jgi:hypothetical protein
VLRVGLGLAVVVVYLALVWYLAVRRERTAKRDAEALGFSFAAGTYCTRCGNRLRDDERHLVAGAWTCGPSRPRPVSFSQLAAKGFKRPGNGAAA